MKQNNQKEPASITWSTHQFNSFGPFFVLVLFTSLGCALFVLVNSTSSGSSKGVAFLIWSVFFFYSIFVCIFVILMVRSTIGKRRIEMRITEWKKSLASKQYELEEINIYITALEQLERGESNDLIAIHNVSTIAKDLLPRMREILATKRGLHKELKEQVEEIEDQISCYTALMSLLPPWRRIFAMMMPYSYWVKRMHRGV